MRKAPRTSPSSGSTAWATSGSSTSTSAPSSASSGSGRGNATTQSIGSTPIVPSHSWSSARSSCKLVRASATNGCGSVQTCASGVSSAAARPDAPAARRSRSIRTTRPSPARVQRAAVARPMTPPPTTSTSGRRSRSGGTPGSRAASTLGAGGVAPDGFRDGHAPRLRGCSCGQRDTADASHPGRTLADSGARSSMDRASDYGSEGWGFESLRARCIRAGQSVSARQARSTHRRRADETLTRTERTGGPGR